MSKRRAFRCMLASIAITPLIASAQQVSPRPQQDMSRAAVQQAGAHLSGSFAPQISHHSPAAPQVKLTHKLGVGDPVPTHFQILVGTGGWRAWQPYTPEPVVPFSPAGSSGQKCDDPAFIKFPVRMQLGRATVLNPSTKLPVVEKYGAPLEGHICYRIPG